MNKLNYVVGNLLDATDKVIAHGVNCQFKMGAGVAKAIRQKYPIVYDRFMCLKPILGNIDPVQLNQYRYIVNMYTQLFYGRDPDTVYVNYDAVSNCFESLFNWMDRCQFNSVAIPKIGTGLANGDWLRISDIIETKLGFYDLGVTVYSLK